MAKRPSIISRHGVDFNVDQGDPLAQGFAEGMQQWVNRPTGPSMYSQNYRQNIWSPHMMRGSGSPAAETQPTFTPRRVLTPEQYISRSAGAGAVTGINDLIKLAEAQASVREAAAPRTPEQAFARSYGAGAVQSIATWEQAQAEGRMNLATGEIEPVALTSFELAQLSAPPGMVPYKQNDDGSWIYVPAGHDDLGPQVAIRATWGHDVEDRVNNLIAANPRLAAQAIEMGMSVEDLADIENMLAAQTSANMAIDALMSGNDSRARQLLMRQSPEMSIISLTIFNDQIEKAQKAYQEARDSGENIFVQLGSAVWNVTIGPFFDLLLAANEFVQQVARANFTGLQENPLRALLGPLNVPINSFQYWDQVAPGYMEPDALNSLRSEYGELQTNIVVEAYMARQYGDDDALDTLFEKYGNDQEALNIIFGAISGKTPDGTNYDNLYREVASLDRGNTGNIIARSLGLDPLAMGFGQVRDVVNVSAFIGLDPTLIGAKARSTYMSAKYGIYQLAGTSNVNRAFGKAKVRRWFDNFGAEVERISKMTDSARRGEATTTLLSQNKRYATSETLEIALKYRLYNADEFRDFLNGMETVEKVLVGRSAPRMVKLSPKWGRGRPGQMKSGGRPIYEERTVVSQAAPDIARLQSTFVQAQSAKRFGQLYTPHMSVATEQVKGVMRSVRGTLNIPGRTLSRSTPVMDDILGRDFTGLPRDAQLARLTTVMQDDAAVAALAAELGDLTGRRTNVSKIVNAITRGDGRLQRRLREGLGLERKGFQRKGVRSEGLREGLARSADRWSRLMARMPDSRAPIRWDTAADANRVYELMRRAGVHRGAASEFRLMWIEMNEAQRRLAYIGLIKMYGRAAGIDLVDPKMGMNSLLEGVTGVRTTELHAANQIPRFGALMREVDQEAMAAAEGIAKVRGGQALTRKEIQGLKNDILSRRIVEGEFAAVNPSVKGDLSSAVWIGQTADQGVFPNISALDQLTARSSYLNAFLFNNKFGQGVTDWWVLGTLAGPRFQLRNGIEEIGLYALTGGKFGNYMSGRAISTGLREGSERQSPKLKEAISQKNKAVKDYDDAVRNNATEEQLDGLKTAISRANENLFNAERLEGGRSRKLGFVKTFNRKAAAAVVNRLERAGHQQKADSLRAWLLPQLAPDEVAAARRAVESGKMTEAQAREAIAELQTFAVARQFLTMMRDPDAQGVALALKRGVPREQMTPRQQQILGWVDDLVRSPAGLRLQDRAAESARHFADGVMPVMDDMNDLPAEGYRMVTFRAGYSSQKIRSQVSAQQAEAIIVGLTQAVSDGPRGQTALRNIKDYWYAINATPTADRARVEEIVARVVKAIDDAPESIAYRSRLSVSQTGDATDIARTPLDTLVGMFTTPTGKFNEKLWRALQVRTDEGKVIFKVTDKVDGEVRSLVTLDDFVKGTYDPPANTLVFGAERYAIPEKMGFQDRVWATIGRSYARMVREPIFGANYIDARQAFLPFEKEWAKIFGSKRAAELATDAATERAYQLTMAYADNPAVRSQLAWEVRNVARFYRAIEDFGRRMGRMATNNPLGFWKASLAWNAALDTGWVYEDEFGDAYFVYPGSKAAISVMNDVMNIIGVGQKVPELNMGVAGKVQWLTPSADPESWLPTLSGPWASFLYRPALRSLPIMDGLTKEFEKAVFGSISASQGLNVEGISDIPFLGEVVSSAPSSLPPFLNKLFLGVGAGVFGAEVPGSFSSRMMQKAALAMAANGDLPPAGLSEKEERDYLNRLDVTAALLSLSSIVFGFALPSAPQFYADNASEFAREMGYLNVRPAFLKFVEQQSKEDIPYEVALAKWISDNPGRSIFTLSANETGQWGYVQATEGNIQFIQNNKEVWEQYPTGATFFTPNNGLNNLASFNTLRAMGYNSPKLGSKYATELLSQEGYVRYLTARSSYRDFMADPNRSDDERRTAATAWTTTNRTLNRLYPGLDRRTRGQGRSVQSDFAASVREAISAAEILAAKGNEKAKVFLELVPSFYAAREKLSNVDYFSAESSAEVSSMKRAWETVVWRFSRRFPEDEQWSNLMYHTTKALNDQWTVPEVDPDRESQ